MLNGKVFSISVPQVSYGEHHMRKATEDDVKYLAPRLRQCDKDEIKANAGTPIQEALMFSMKLLIFPL